MSDQPSSPRQKRGCLLLMLGAIAFIAIIYAILIFLIKSNQTPENQAQERQTVVRCFERLETLEDSAHRTKAEENCQEMAEQYQDKYDASYKDAP
ncbi:hypothetical protein [Larsenimonas suaedae]|uniref:Uncharacterized protein n=1 Tax=Larsenimonas suaedae TaxID=1851019 RepID=A0ABU1GTZ8_9GAMM|nr:hypothetical protein [Larsenimonas suaedae]MCM2972232.1 hypothetical protein [Larsenimonas suaedae]MDR5894972.1 hypothetical protein [Larsenimonas suaedae]